MSEDAVEAEMIFHGYKEELLVVDLHLRWGSMNRTDVAKVVFSMNASCGANREIDWIL